MIRDALGIIVLIALLIGMAWAWRAYNALPGAPVGLSVAATEADEVQRAPVVEVEVKKPVLV